MKKIISLMVVLLLVTVGGAACSSPQPENMQELGDSYLAAENYEEAMKAYEEGLKSSPDSPELHKKLVESAFLLGDVEKGSKYLDQLNAIYEKIGDGEGLAWVTKMRSLQAEKVIPLAQEQREYLEALVSLAQEKDYENLYTKMGLDSFTELFKSIPLDEETQTHQFLYDTALTQEEVIFTLDEGEGQTRSFNFGDEEEGETTYIYYTAEYKNDPEEEESYPALVAHFYTSKDGVGEGPYYYYAYTPESNNLILHNSLGHGVQGIRDGEETTFLEYASGVREEIVLTYVDGYLQLPDGGLPIGSDGEEPQQGRVGRQVDGGDVVYLP